MKLRNPFSDLTKFERGLYGVSVLSVLLTFLLPGGRDPLTIIASLIGVTALIFVAKGYVIGQVLTVVFAAFYGIISFFFRYYGEMITYLGMTAPIAALTVVSWLRHPYAGTKEVRVHRLTRGQFGFMAVSAAAVTAVFYFILRALGNANLLFSTVSVTTSYIASFLTLFRSPFYAPGYAANDLVLIILWVLAAREDPGCLPMIVCFAAFFANDMYGFFAWRRMQARQAKKP